MGCSNGCFSTRARAPSPASGSDGFAASVLEVVGAGAKIGAGIMGVVDGSSPKGVEQDSDKAARKTLLRTFGYKVK